MNPFWLQTASIVCAVILAAVAIFQLMLYAGMPYGEYVWGGRHAGVLPQRLRRWSLLSALLLLAMGFVYLLHAGTVAIDSSFAWTRVLCWVITAFLGLNTLGNLASRSPKEKRAMTPLSGAAFILGLLISAYGAS